jgi:hypothetical protein
MSTKSIVILILAVGGLLVVGGFATCAGLLFLGFRNMDQSISPAVDELFASIDDDTFAETYDTHTTAAFRQAVSREQYEALGLTIESRLGGLVSKSLRNMNVRHLNGRSFTDVAYHAKFEKGEGTIRCQWQLEDGKWRLVSLNVDSPALLQDMVAGKCPHCGEPHTSGAQFCSKCGKTLVEPIATEIDALLETSDR